MAARAARHPLRAPRNHTEMLRISRPRRNAGLRRRAPARPAVPRHQPTSRRSPNATGTDDRAALAAQPRPGSPVRAGMELPASDPVLTPLANAPAQEAQSPTESTEFVWEMTGGAPNPPFFFHTGLRHMAWKDFGGSHNTGVAQAGTASTP